MKTTVDIPEPLYKKAKIRAVKQGQTLHKFVLEALDTYLNSEETDVPEKTSSEGTDSTISDEERRASIETRRSLDRRNPR